MKDYDVDVDWNAIIRGVSLESGRVLSIVKTDVNRRIPMESKVLIVGEIKGIGIQDMRDSRLSWKGKIQIGKTGGLGSTYGPVTEEIDAEFPELYTIPMDGGVKVAFVIPFNWNPHLVLASILNKKYFQILSKSLLRVVGYFNSTAGVCKYCGKQVEMSLVSLSGAPACVSCVAKASLKQ